MQRLSADILKSFGTVNVPAVDRILAEEIARDRHKIVVLDDDPTGVQTVHDVSVFTGWDRASVLEGFREDRKLFYILTNSRGMTPAETEAAHREMIANNKGVAAELATPYKIISRSDSTLRG
ncbi:MAG: hydroxyacid dehydrogenase, partial [Firmicutes bacterium]|nr:hydroxyacid dehydrogenase [Bacillota bacterium]